MLSWLSKKAQQHFGNASVDAAGEPIAPPTVPMPVDADLLKRAVLQWRFGDWPSLAALSDDLLNHHPHVQRLALLAMAGRFQTGDMKRVRELHQRSKALGCSDRAIARVLVSGVHNTIGVARALLDDQESALTHFWKSLHTGDPGCDLRLLAPVRANQQALLFGLPQRGVWQPLLNKWGNSLAISGKGSGAPLFAGAASRSHIVIAGMRHSGSTALFNIVRLALKASGIKYESGYSEHEFFVQAAGESGKLRVIKTHEFRDDVAETGGLIITTRRDLRDTVASAVRRGFATVNKVGGPIDYARYNRALHDLWQPYSDFEFEYEAFMSTPLDVIRTVLAFLGLDARLATAIQTQVTTLPTDRYRETLLSPTHITDPERKLSFWDTLSPDVILQINKEHGRWLERYGYSV